MNQKYSKQEILLEGISLFRRKGYHNLGTKEILDECGIPKGSFYNFFSSKADYALQALALYGKSMLDLIRRFTRDEALSPLERISNYLELTLQANTEEGMRFGCLSMNFATELAGYNDEFAALNKTIFQYWIQEIAACLEKGQDLGEVRNDYTAEELAEYLYLNIFGAYAKGKMERNTTTLERQLQMTLDFLGNA
ncbi:MAG: TetR family transcriptional regulator C-terminal domain-containing protein [Bacteroidota bacterium]